MSARLLIKKYTGKDGDFGTPVSSIGLKRVDTCVPSVYSSAALENTGHTVPADDASEAGAYCVYRPDNPECYSYSMESVFKIHLIKAPDIQLSNIRLYPIGERPTSPTAAKLYIGNSISYSRPTDQKSQIALNDIWNYSKEHPFYLTVAGLYGQVPDPRLSQEQYTVEYKDCGFGNLIYINGDRQPTLTVATRTHGDEAIVYTFENKSGFPIENFIEFIPVSHDKPTLEDAKPLGEPYVYHPAICDANGQATSETDPTKICLVVLDPSYRSEQHPDGLDLIRDYPYGLIYKRPADEHRSNFGTGGAIQMVYLYNGQPGTYGENNPAYVPTEWHNTTIDENGNVTTNDNVDSPFKDSGKPTFSFDVVVENDNFGHTSYVINGVRRPMLNFDLNAVYVFHNRSGASFPMRFIGNPFSPIANFINDVVVDGVIVANGATNDETIYVDPEAVLKAGKKINAYQCVTAPELGSFVHNVPLCMCGNYNLCRVDGGIYNPLKAGETDYVYLQLEVGGNADPGYCVPDIQIEYDEN
jgi:hypothetical protein